MGKDNYLVFLTADHGVAHNSDFLAENQIPAGSFKIDSVTVRLNGILQEKFGDGQWIVSNENMELYLNRELMADKKVTKAELFQVIRPYLMSFPAVADVIDLQNIATSPLQSDIRTKLTNGYNLKRSGDFQILYNPSWIENFTQVATHGTPYAYDTHIPLLFMGWKVKHHIDYNPIDMTDIAPTLAALLHIQEPSGSVGKVIVPLLGE